jgi:hypothetical protein
VSDRIWVATRKGLFRLEGNGRWAISGVAFLGDNVSMVLPDRRDGTVYAALDHGHCAVPVYPPAEPGDDHLNAWTGQPYPNRLVRIWALEAGIADQPGLLWCGTIPGALFRSADGGDSWQIVQPLWKHPKRKEWFGGGADHPGIHSVCVHPQDGRHVAVGVSCGGVWVTTDGGETWNCRADGMWAAYMPPEKKDDPNVQDPHRVVQCPARPDCLWAQHHNGIFRTTDGAATWREVKDVPPSNFGFAVAVHPRDPDTAWFVPGVNDQRRVPVSGQVVVTRTRDGGKSFDVLRHGLPQQHAYDITYRHGLDVDETGDSLAFGSTTGGLWTSDNGGDSWQCVGEHLPPVYCVRFEK